MPIYCAWQKNSDRAKPPDLTNSGVGGVQMAEVQVDTDTGIAVEGEENGARLFRDCGGCLAHRILKTTAELLQRYGAPSSWE